MNGAIVYVSASTIHYPVGGGHLWVFLNWALGLKANGCRVHWMELVDNRTPEQQTVEYALQLERRLRRYDLADGLTLCFANDRPVPKSLEHMVLQPEQTAEADLLLNFNYGLPDRIVSPFRRSALVDIDPGLLQMWLHDNRLTIASHDSYFTTGETVGTERARFPGCGIGWKYTPPCVSLEHWPVTARQPGDPYTTVSHWSMGDWVHHDGEDYSNDKRSGFLPFLDLPSRVDVPLQLALCLSPNEAGERDVLEKLGWSVIDAYDVSSTPWEYQAYIHRSSGEFSCVKPSCVRLQNAWISDRTLCYLASGKPAVIQHTGPSRILPDAAGLLRFRTLDEARARLLEAEENYDRHAAAARSLVEESFDARNITRRLLDRAI